MSRVIDNWNAKPVTSLSPCAWPVVRPKREDPQWVISDIWPFDMPQCGGIPEPTRWEFEPSGYVGKIEIRAVDVRPTADLEFEQQKDAFNRISPPSLIPYRGLFVASREGVIVDSDADLPSLTSRFFSQHGDVPVYITRVGGRQRVLLRTPHTR